MGVLHPPLGHTESLTSPSLSSRLPPIFGVSTPTYFLPSRACRGRPPPALLLLGTDLGPEAAIWGPGGGRGGSNRGVELGEHTNTGQCWQGERTPKILGVTPKILGVTPSTWGVCTHLEGLGTGGRGGGLGTGTVLGSGGGSGVGSGGSSLLEPLLERVVLLEPLEWGTSPWGPGQGSPRGHHSHPGDRHSPPVTLGMSPPPVTLVSPTVHPAVSLTLCCRPGESRGVPGGHPCAGTCHSGSATNVTSASPRCHPCPQTSPRVLGTQWDVPQCHRTRFVPLHRPLVAADPPGRAVPVLRLRLPPALGTRGMRIELIPKPRVLSPDPLSLRCHPPVAGTGSR